MTIYMFCFENDMNDLRVSLRIKHSCIHKMIYHIILKTWFEGVFSHK